MAGIVAKLCLQQTQQHQAAPTGVPDPTPQKAVLVPVRAPAAEAGKVTLKSNFDILYVA